MKYNLFATDDSFDYHANEFREVPDSTCIDNAVVIPDPDSIPLSVLNHPLGKRDEINFAAYDLSVVSPMKGDHPMLVLCLDSSFEFLTRKQAWSILRIHLPRWRTRRLHGEVHLH